MQFVQQTYCCFYTRKVNEVAAFSEKLIKKSWGIWRLRILTGKNPIYSSVEVTGAWRWLFKHAIASHLKKGNYWW